LELVELDATVIDVATELCAYHPGALRTPDAVQLACAVTSGADQFLTGDKKLAAIQEVKVAVV
jgi:predicted nucleic acid-binding protein